LTSKGYINLNYTMLDLSFFDVSRETRRGLRAPLKTLNFLSIIAEVSMQGKTVQELLVASSSFNAAVVHLL